MILILMDGSWSKWMITAVVVNEHSHALVNVLVTISLLNVIVISISLI